MSSAVRSGAGVPSILGNHGRNTGPDRHQINPATLFLWLKHQRRPGESLTDAATRLLVRYVFADGCTLIEAATALHLDRDRPVTEGAVKVKMLRLREKHCPGLRRENRVEFR